MSFLWVFTVCQSTCFCYKFFLNFSLQIYQGSTLLVDSGPVHDSTIRGGKVGVFQFGPFQMIWSYLKVNCLEHWNQGLYLDGKDDFILLDDIPTLKMEERYGIIWAAM